MSVGLDQAQQLAELLQKYGGWGLTAILCSALVGLFILHERRYSQFVRSMQEQYKAQTDAAAKAHKESEDRLVTLLERVVGVCVSTQAMADRVLVVLERVEDELDENVHDPRSAGASPAHSA